LLEYVKDKVLLGQSAALYLRQDRPTALRVAKNSGRDLQELFEELGKDKDFGIDPRNERALYVCVGVDPSSFQEPSGEIEAASSAFADSAEPAISQAFLLHSRPSSSRTIYLDFNGHEAVDTAWNDSGIVVTPPYSIDSDPAFSNAELTNIVAIWRAVAEDFAAFDVDVTTEYPGSEIAIGNPGGTGPGMRVAIGGSSLDWYGAPAGGVAYVGAFGSSFYAPAYVFPAQLGNGGPKFVAEAISHEGKGDSWHYLLIQAFHNACPAAAIIQQQHCSCFCIASLLD
jgi:hypothetical protein